MTQNMPNALRRTYVLMAAAAFLAAFFVSTISTVERLAIGAAGAMLLASAASGYCACYALFSRCKSQLRRD